MCSSLEVSEAGEPDQSLRVMRNMKSSPVLLSHRPEARYMDSGGGSSSRTGGEVSEIRRDGRYSWL